MSGRSHLILASASPRRRELLGYLRIPFDVKPASGEEHEPEVVDEPGALARDLALAKAREVASDFQNSFVLGADTIVALGNRILGKPHDADEARATLRTLRGRSHHVITALALVSPSGERLDHARTEVRMRDYSDAEIEAYIERGEPFDKAGSYAIQDPVFQPVERCSGCYCNVVGLPILGVWAMLTDAGLAVPNVNPLSLPTACKQCPLWKKCRD